MSRQVKAKRECCHSSPRCKSCPVVLKRLEQSGHAKRISKRVFRVSKLTPKALKAARTR